jgi:transposase
LDYSKFEEHQSTFGRPNAASPRQMMELIIYGKLLGYNSCRAFQHLKTDLCAMWILENKKLPSYSTFDKFISNNQNEIEELFYQLVMKIKGLGEVKGETIFQDGTKIESPSNKYTFVWRKALDKNMPKTFSHLKTAYEAFIEMFPESKIVEHLSEENALSTMIEIRRFLRIQFPGIDDAKCGRGIRASKEVKLFRIIAKEIEPWIKYILYSDTFSKKNNPTERNSFSKTDTDTTFMHIKEDYMRNSQSKPAYNIQNLVDSNYIVSTYCSADRTDFHTCVPALKKLQGHLPFKYKNYCADTGYDCKENYEYLEKHNIKSYIKPTMYNSNKKRKNRSDPNRRSNMKYLPNIDAYECTQGKYFSRRIDIEKRNSEYSIKHGCKTKPNQRIYRAFSGCLDCHVREDCMRAASKKYDFRTLRVDSELDRYRAQTTKNIESIEGKLINSS